jgi:hypothetical protein
VYSEHSNGEDVYFLEGNNEPVKVESIEKINYFGRIYDVDVENDIVLVRRNSEGNTGKAVWSGNSNSKAVDVLSRGIMGLHIMGL